MKRPMATHRLKDKLRQARPKPKEVEEKPKEDQFRVLLCIHRPKYRSRVERAVAAVDWNLRSLTIKEDPIGLINQKRPDIFIITIDSTKNKNVGFLKACQKWRSQGMRVICILESEADNEVAEGLCDSTLESPWKSVHVRDIVSDIYRKKRGKEPVYSTEIQHLDDDNTAEELE